MIRQKLNDKICLWGIVVILTFASSLLAQPQEFTLMDREYRYEGGKWYTYFQGQIGDEIIPDRLVVRLSNSGDMKSFDFDVFNIKGVSVFSERFLDGYYVLSVAPESDPFQIAPQLENTTLFDVIEFDAYGQQAGTPNDPHFAPDQWNLKSDKLNMEAAWNISTGSSSVIVAIIDGGALYSHEDLNGNIWVNPAEDRNGNGLPDFSAYPGGDEDGIDNDGNGKVDDLIGWNFHSNNNMPGGDLIHGTWVTGVVGAETSNGLESLALLADGAVKRV